MSALLAQFGVGGDELASQHTEQVAYPQPTPGRVAHIDADFLAYQVSAETRDELDGLKPRKSFEDMQHNARKAAEHFQRLVGATDYRCHVTPSGSDKGGRPAQAVQQEYQANRKGKEKPEFLDAMRAYIGQELNGVVHLTQEADDGMAQANYRAQGANGAWGGSNLSVIVSLDKDLRMVPGLHWDFDNECVHAVCDSFGTIWLDDSGSAKKVKGWGTKFFWAQCLMGDAADSIKGLPFMAGSDFQPIAPSAAYGKLRKRLDEADEAKRPAILKAIEVENAKRKQVGPVMAYEYLKDVYNDRDAFKAVKHAWQNLSTDTGYEFTHWVTGEVVTPTQALLGDMLLLWMRRNDNPRDVIDWIKERCV